MPAIRKTSVSRLISRLLEMQPCEDGIATEEHFGVLKDTVDADAFVILRIYPGSGNARILSGTGLQTPVDQGRMKLETPFLVESAIHSPDAPVFRSEGPFGDDPFLKLEGVRSLMMKMYAAGGTYQVTAAIRRSDKPFKKGEADRFTAVSGVIDLLGRYGRLGEGPDPSKSRDVLTGLGLFSEFHDTMIKELSRARRGGGTVTMGIVSVVAEDPVTRDDALLDITRTFQDQLRNFDTLVRYGTMELAFILPDLKSAEGLRVMDRVMGGAVSYLGGRDKAPDIYVGLSCYPEDGATVERLIEMAEAAMNQAMEDSRPGVYRWEEEDSEQ